ncbi:MAG: hypothetical protein ACO1N2_02220 [Candidatus Saccharimonadota bacterium]
MSIFVQATPAPAAKSHETKQIATLYAGLLTILAVTQLFTFDEFIELFPQLGLPVALAPIIVACEVFALPFLLRMRLSPAFRALSMGLGWLVALGWLFVSIVAVQQGTTETVGYLGTLVNFIPGWSAVLIAASFGILAAWSSWGLWPFRRSRK